MNCTCRVCACVLARACVFHQEHKSPCLPPEQLQRNGWLMYYIKSYVCVALMIKRLVFGWLELMMRCSSTIIMMMIIMIVCVCVCVRSPSGCAAKLWPTSSAWPRRATERRGTACWCYCSPGRYGCPTTRHEHTHKTHTCTQFQA